MHHHKAAIPTVPVSTYRLQLRSEFGFEAAAKIVPYLAELGVSHIYCSPVLEAAPGSAHGYDVVDHSSLSEELGGDTGWSKLVTACAGSDLGLIIDIVPNHMALPTPASLNPALWEVLSRGRDALTSAWLDVDWDADNGKILMPVLGKSLIEAIADDEISIDTEQQRIRYFDQEFPIAAHTADGLELTSADGINELLGRQHFELADWHEAAISLNYRRFFDVTTLLGVRVERADVFRATHARVLELIADGEVSGLRIDHIDGLADPTTYLQRLAAATDGRWTVVEKILAVGESLPMSWACAGTSGYDAVTAINNLFVEPAAAPAFDDIWREQADASLTDWPTVVDESKRQVLADSFHPEVARLVHDAFGALDAAAIHRPDESLLTAATIELLVAMDTYRAYPESLDRLDAAAGRAATQRPDLSDQISLLRELAERPLEIDAPTPAATAFARRFAQTCGPVMAKGVEDTAFYRFHRLVALNEVGGEPGTFGLPVADFHDFCGRLAAEWPTTMTTLSTHDTKRSEDVRARLFTLAELPDTWSAAVNRWNGLADDLGLKLDSATRYLIWQTLVGAWPLPVDRLIGYLDKATREAKLRTSWTEPAVAYDEAVRQFARTVTGDPGLVADLETWVRDHVLVPGRIVALSQKLVQLTMPGVPDIYQGNESTDLSLVDPDNRRPVDYELRMSMASSTDLAVLAADDVGANKFAVTKAALRVRQSHRELFATGSYTPLTSKGEQAANLIAFARGDDVVTLATRLPVGLAENGGWGDTAVELPTGQWRDAITDRRVTSGVVGGILNQLPVALLVRDEGPQQ